MDQLHTDLAGATASVAHCPQWLVNVLEFFQTGSNLVGLVIILIGLVVAVTRWVWLELSLLKDGTHSSSRWARLHGVRLFLGTYILMGLEFMIVSDIIHSFLKPNMESLYTLGMIVAIRTVISFFLGREIEPAAQGAS